MNVIAMNLVAMRTLTLIVLCSLSVVAQEVLQRPTESNGILGQGTAWATPWYEIDSTVDGPTVVITGGVHGNEPAGFRAAEQIRFWPIKRGRLIVIPKVNRLGLQASMRWFPPARNNRELRDLNRNFPTGDSGTPRGELAVEVWRFVKSSKPDLVVDLHEGFDFHTANQKSVGSSVICSPTEQTTRLATRMQAAVNSTIKNKQRQFDLLNKSGAVPGSLIRAVSNELKVNAFILETTFKDQSLSLRTRQHRIMVSTLLNEVGMIDRDCSAVVGRVARDRSTADAADSVVRVGLFDGPGTTAAGRSNLHQTLDLSDDFMLCHFGAVDVTEDFLRQFDVLVFSGGSGSKQGKALGPKRRLAIREFIRSGGGIVGICAGAYLCSAHYDWSLHVIDTAVYNKMEDIPGVGRKSMWYRGPASDVNVELTQAGVAFFGRQPGVTKDGTNNMMSIRYQNGPIVSAGKGKGLPPYKVLAVFRSEVAKYQPQKGTMVNTPAIVSADFGKGRVLSISPHPEATQALRPIVSCGIRWAAGLAVDAK